MNDDRMLAMAERIGRDLADKVVYQISRVLGVRLSMPLDRPSSMANEAKPPEPAEDQDQTTGSADPAPKSPKLPTVTGSADPAPAVSPVPQPDKTSPVAVVDRIAERVKPVSQAMSETTPAKSPVDAPDVAAVAPIREPNMGSVHVEPKEGKQSLSWAGNVAMKLHSVLEKNAAYGNVSSPLLSNSASLFKSMSSMMGDKHTFGPELRHRVRMTQLADRAISALQPSEPPAPAPTQPPAMSEFSFGPGDAKPSPEAPPTPGTASPPSVSWLPQIGKSSAPEPSAGSSFVVGPKATASSMTPQGSNDIGPLVRSIDELVRSLKEFIRTQSAKDDGKTDESSSASNRRVGSPMPSMELPERTTPRQTGVIVVPPPPRTGMYRPHI